VCTILNRNHKTTHEPLSPDAAIRFQHYLKSIYRAKVHLSINVTTVFLLIKHVSDE
jgi:hypothetical protein